MRNGRIRQIMEVENTVVEMIEQKPLMWYGNLRRMAEVIILRRSGRMGTRGKKKEGEPKEKLD